MEPLHRIKRMLIWVYMCKPEKTANKWTKTKYFIVGSVVLILNLGALAAHFAYIYKYLFTDLKGSLFAFFGIFGFFGVSYIMITAMFLQEKITEIFERLSEIYGMCKLLLCNVHGFDSSIDWLTLLFSGENTDLSRFLIKANKTSDWVWTISLKFMLVYFFNISTMSILSVFFCWFSNKNFDVNEFYHPLNMM